MRLALGAGKVRVRRKQISQIQSTSGGALGNVGRRRKTGLIWPSVKRASYSPPAPLVVHPCSVGVLRPQESLAV